MKCDIDQTKCSRGDGLGAKEPKKLNADWGSNKVTFERQIAGTSRALNYLNVAEIIKFSW